MRYGFYTVLRFLGMMFFMVFFSGACPASEESFWVSQKAFPEILRQSGGRLLLVDVREVSEFNRVHIPGSVNVPLSDLGRNADGVAAFLKSQEGLDEVLLICNTHNRSRRARALLMEKGIPLRLRVLEMGVTGYLRERKREGGNGTSGK